MTGVQTCALPISTMYLLNLDYYDKWDAIEPSSDMSTLHDQLLQMQADVQSDFTLDDQMITKGILTQEISESNQFYAGCISNLLSITSAVLAYDYNGYISASDDYDAQCSDAAWDEANNKYENAWNDGWNAYFNEIIDESNSIFRQAVDSREAAEDFYNENIL